MDFEEQSKKYQSDPEFHALVDKICYLLSQGHFTIDELKSAVVFAGLKFERERMRPAPLGESPSESSKELRAGANEFPERIGKTKQGEAVYRHKHTGELSVEKDGQYLVPATQEEIEGVRWDERA